MTAKIEAIRQTQEGQGLRRVYVMTNGAVEWVEELKASIMQMGGWEDVASSRDLVMTPEQKYIGQAVDMAIAMRAQVFIGNGVSWFFFSFLFFLRRDAQSTETALLDFFPELVFKFELQCCIITTQSRFCFRNQSDLVNQNPVYTILPFHLVLLFRTNFTSCSGVFPVSILCVCVCLRLFIFNLVIFFLVDCCCVVALSL